MYIRKKTFILIITYLAAAVVALGAYTAVHFGMEGSYRRTAEYGYAHAFEEVVGSVSALSDSLHRASYASGAELSGQLCADIYGSCLAAEMTMAVLPFSTQELEQTAAFIGIAGDYARGSLRTSAQSGFDDAARRNFASLYKTAAALTRELSDRTLPSASTHTLPPLNAKHTVPFSALYSASSLSLSSPKNSAAMALASLCATGFFPVLCAVFAYFPS